MLTLSNFEDYEYGHMLDLEEVQHSWKVSLKGRVLKIKKKFNMLCNNIVKSKDIYILKTNHNS